MITGLVYSLRLAVPASPSQEPLPDLDAAPCRTCSGGGCPEICEACEEFEAWESRRQLKEHRPDASYAV